MVFNREEYANTLTSVEILIRERNYIQRVAFLEKTYQSEEERLDLIEKLRIVGQKFGEHRRAHPEEDEESSGDSEEWLQAWGCPGPIVRNPEALRESCKRPRSDEDSEEWRQAWGCPFSKKPHDQ